MDGRLAAGAQRGDAPGAPAAGAAVAAIVARWLITGLASLRARCELGARPREYRVRLLVVRSQRFLACPSARRARTQELGRARRACATLDSCRPVQSARLPKVRFALYLAAARSPCQPRQLREACAAPTDQLPYLLAQTVRARYCAVRWARCVRSAKAETGQLQPWASALQLTLVLLRTGRLLAHLACCANSGRHGKAASCGALLSAGQFRRTVPRRAPARAVCVAQAPTRRGAYACVAQPTVGDSGAGTETCAAAPWQEPQRTLCSPGDAALTAPRRWRAGCSGTVQQGASLAP